MNNIGLTLTDILYAISKYPYPIEYRKIIPSPLLPYQEELLTPIDTVTLDIRKYASEAYKQFQKEQQENDEKYRKLYNEFEQYKREHHELEMFKRFKREYRS